MTATFPVFVCFQLRTSQRKPNKHVPQINHIWCSLFSYPTAILQSFSQAYLKPFLFFPTKLSHSLTAFDSLPNTSDGSWFPCFNKLWINSLCLLLFGWFSFISAVYWDVKGSTSLILKELFHQDVIELVVMPLGEHLLEFSFLFFQK